MKRYGKYIKPYLSAFILGPMFMLVEVFGEIVLPKLMAIIVNVVEDIKLAESTGLVIANGPAEVKIVEVGFLMIVTALVMALGGIAGAYFAAKASINFAADIRQDAFKKVQKFSFANIDKFSTGSLVTRLTNDVTQVQNLINMSLRMMLRAPGMLIGAVIMAFVLNPKLALVIVVVIPILVVTIIIVMRIAFPRFQALQAKIDGLNSTIRESLQNVRVIKSFVRDDFETEKFRKSNDDLKETGLRAFRVMIAVWPLMGVAINVTTLAIVWFGGKMVISSEMTIGDLTAFITYVMQILFSLVMVSMIILQSSRAFASAKRINEVLDCENDLNDDSSAHKEKEVETGAVRFENVSFRYYKDSEEKVLDDITLDIKSGETVGIIGSTGSGKTTLVSLIPRLYDADEGNVYVDGINVKDYSLKNLRDGVSVVLQKNVLFSGSIEENLLWGDENASREEMVNVAGLAMADAFVSTFEEGYDTDLGQGGVNVSGGQKQRLCIARALLKKPKILIFDDSTSAVDTATEAVIRKNLKEFCPDTTKIIIAQRISSVIEADKIVVIDDGKVVGLGDHNELINSCEAYKEIYYSQMDKEELA